MSWVLGLARPKSQDPRPRGFLKVVSDFVTSAAGAEGLPKDGLPELAMVGRSNVGKSSLINALVRKKLARTSAAPGKTRLANFYRVAATRNFAACSCSSTAGIPASTAIAARGTGSAASA